MTNTRTTHPVLHTCPDCGAPVLKSLTYCVGCDHDDVDVVDSELAIQDYRSIYEPEDEDDERIIDDYRPSDEQVQFLADRLEAESDKDACTADSSAGKQLCPSGRHFVTPGFTCFYGCHEWAQYEAEREAGPDDELAEFLADACGIGIVDGIAYPAGPRRA